MPEPRITVLPPVTLAPFMLATGWRPHWAYMGMWAAYAPALQLKLLHSVGGHVHSIAHVAPRRDRAGDPGDPDAAWARAFAKPIARRAAENWVMLERLHKAGLGPEPLGLAVAPRYRAWFSRGLTHSAGTLVADLHRYPPKVPATEEQVRAAGVIPDARLACVREQINGYVSDLNAVRGAMPEDAGEEVAALTERLDAALRGAR
ncbi:hypothetical protein Rumeso_01940 [Rubellimicrobium mesophilum DSM 19309]|uniref:Uncharacterized protein n=1 Tax=Rubellimicrobium mesophilum DSM 19309 TaxID=442562 RepID=A0A017HRZ5_9RHOB|nr:hypothetical protein [Rubellimicrobium mesophilum]EYD76519.1 hypothetical protein Rumeso_01940 [Rubellimicrobium mesophilum DSM 19309]